MLYFSSTALLPQLLWNSVHLSKLKILKKSSMTSVIINGPGYQMFGLECSIDRKPILTVGSIRKLEVSGNQYIKYKVQQNANF